MRKVYLLMCATAAVAFWTFGSQVHAVTVWQQDVFDGPTTESWDGGSSPMHAAAGGPAGGSDGYLQISSTNFNLGTKNGAQWTGDYVSEGVSSMSMDLNNLGADGIEFRVLIQGPGGSFTSTAPFVLPAFSGWQSASFGLTDATLTHVLGGSGTLSDTLASVSRVLLRHDDGGPSAPGVEHYVTTTVGIDNITAVGVPEASSLALLFTGVMLLGPRRRR